MELPLSQRHAKNISREVQEQMDRIRFDQAWNFTHFLLNANLARPE